MRGDGSDVILLWPTVAVLGFFFLAGVIIVLGATSTSRYEFERNRRAGPPAGGRLRRRHRSIPRSRQSRRHPAAGTPRRASVRRPARTVRQTRCGASVRGARRGPPRGPAAARTGRGTDLVAGRRDRAGRDRPDRRRALPRLDRRRVARLLGWAGRIGAGSSRRAPGRRRDWCAGNRRRSGRGSASSASSWTGCRRSGTTCSPTTTPSRPWSSRSPRRWWRPGSSLHDCAGDGATGGVCLTPGPHYAGRRRQLAPARPHGRRAGAG